VSRAPEELWTAITDYQAMPQWRPAGLARVERLPDRNGHAVWKEVSRDGWELPLEDTVVEPPRRLVRTIADPELPFSGNWTYELRAETGGCALKVTENGEVSNPIFRLISRFSDQAGAVVRFETALAAKFGEPARIDPPR
jgi:uncharacterized protein YndB with AHSA1/START domain